MKRRTLLAGIAMVGGALTFSGCMENEMIAPEMLEDTENLELYFPERGEAWERRTPEQAGLDAELLEEAVDHALSSEADTPADLREYLQSRFGDLPDQEILGPLKERGGANGIIVHKGYIVAEWGETGRADMAFSVSKSFLSTLVGLAHDRGLIPSLDAPVGQLVTDGGYESAQNAPITWAQSLQQTSEWEGVLWDKPDSADRREGRDRELQPPGTFWEYNDVRVNRLALSATRVWGASLSDVLAREVMVPIGATRSWRWHGYENSMIELDGAEVQVVSGGGHWGGGLWINTRDLARFGYLYLRRGMWRESRILSEEWVAAATAPSDLNPTYGYRWWLNTEGELWPDAPPASYAARGGGDNILWIDPEHELVVVARWIQRGTEGRLFELIADAASRL
jgi:CubicO group peptidase (beta-lactamase class C family)